MQPIDASDIRFFLDWALKGKPSWPRYIVGLVLGYLAFNLLNNLFILVTTIPLAIIGGGEGALTPVARNVSLALSFLPTLILVPAIVRYLLQRPWWSVAFADKHARWFNLGLGALIGLLVNLVLWLSYPVLGLGGLTFAVPALGAWIPFALLSAAAIFVQTTAEEFLFRGYLMQFVRRATSNPILLIMGSGLLFGLVHAGNAIHLGLGDGFFAVLPWVIDGLFFGWVAWRSKSLWMSMGIHWANNASLAMLFSFKDSADLYAS
jgi:uncharacterized protein